MTVPRYWGTLLIAAFLGASSASAFAGVQMDPLHARFGQHLSTSVPTKTGYVDEVWGRALDLGVRAQSDEDFANIAREFVDSYSSMFGVTGAELSLVEVHHHDLSRIGTTDKVSVEFAQM